ncbi:MAG: DUF177 domain-containing protein [Chlorobiaceae bacterium]|nr:DUF177 domain-containing protein [Chlorobiaceae bacterium]
MSKERALIEVRLAGLSQGAYEFDFACSAGDFGDTALTEAGFSKDISVKVVVDRTDNEMSVTLTTVAKADLSCDLCLAPITMELHGSYRIYYSYEQAAEQNEDRDEEEYRLIDSNALSIDLTEDARETLLLSVPMKVTCTDNPDCQVFIQEGQNESDGDATPPDSSWQESLEKLKNKYR